MNTVEAYDPATNAWRSLPPLQTPRVYAGAQAFEGGHILVVGGLGVWVQVPRSQLMTLRLLRGDCSSSSGRAVGDGAGHKRWL